MLERSYIAIDLKSFYASVECVDRKLDPFKAKLVVADISRTEKTICLAVSPALKELGVPGRPRLFEVIQKVNEINKANPEKKISFITATPRMARYMEVSSFIYSIYLKYVSRDDVIIYSIDEVFIDATAYLDTYHMTARELAMKMIEDVFKQTGITATAGVGTNLYLAKVAMDIVAKHAEPDKNGVRLAVMDEMAYRKLLWNHKPITDFWRVGPGTAKTLEKNGMFTMGDVARMSVKKGPVKVHIDRPRKSESPVYLMESGEDLLYRLFGVNAELLIDHAWGWEPCTIDVIKQYKPETNSLSSGQVLHEPYDFEKARIIVMEMADELSMSLLRKGLVTDRIELYIGFDRMSLSESNGVYKYRNGDVYAGKVSTDHYGRQHPVHANGGKKLELYTASSGMLIDAAAEIYDEKVDPRLLVRRINITACSVISEEEAKKSKDSKEEEYVQLDLFTDYGRLEEERKQRDEALDKEKRLQNAMLTIKDKYGKNAVLRGLNYREGARGRERNREVGGHKA